MPSSKGQTFYVAEKAILFKTGRLEKLIGLTGNYALEIFQELLSRKSRRESNIPLSGLSETMRPILDSMRIWGENYRKREHKKEAQS